MYMGSIWVVRDTWHGGGTLASMVATCGWDVYLNKHEYKLSYLNPTTLRDLLMTRDLSNYCSKHVRPPLTQAIMGGRGLKTWLITYLMTK